MVKAGALLTIFLRRVPPKLPPLPHPPEARLHLLRVLEPLGRGLAHLLDLGQQLACVIVYAGQAALAVCSRGVEALEPLAADVLQKQVPGDFVEAGVFTGGVSIFMTAMLCAHGVLGDGVAHQRYEQQLRREREREVVSSKRETELRARAQTCMRLSSEPVTRCA